jgi:hypothetical protein
MIDRIGLGADHQSSPALVLRLVLQVVTPPAITNFCRVPVVQEGRGCFLAGNIRPALPEPNCDRDKSDPVARDRYKESRPRAS